MYLERRDHTRVGRPTEMKSRKRGTNVSFYMDDEMMQVLEKMRWTEHDSVSGIVRKAVEEYLKNHAEGNPFYSLDKWQKDPNFKALPTLLSPKETWTQHIQNSCNKEERTKIAIIASHIFRVIEGISTREAVERQKNNRSWIK